jgi:hypothetical protein
MCPKAENSAPNRAWIDCGRRNFERACVGTEGWGDKPEARVDWFENAPTWPVLELELVTTYFYEEFPQNWKWLIDVAQRRWWPGEEQREREIAQRGWSEYGWFIWAVGLSLVGKTTKDWVIGTKKSKVSSQEVKNAVNDAWRMRVEIGEDGFWKREKSLIVELSDLEKEHMYWYAPPGFGKIFQNERIVFNALRTETQRLTRTHRDPLHSVGTSCCKTM